MSHDYIHSTNQIASIAGELIAAKNCVYEMFNMQMY